MRIFDWLFGGKKKTKKAPTSRPAAVARTRAGAKTARQQPAKPKAQSFSSLLKESEEEMLAPGKPARIEPAKIEKETPQAPEGELEKPVKTERSPLRKKPTLPVERPQEVISPAIEEPPFEAPVEFEKEEPAVEALAAESAIPAEEETEADQPAIGEPAPEPQVEPEPEGIEVCWEEVPAESSPQEDQGQAPVMDAVEEAPTPIEEEAEYLIAAVTLDDDAKEIEKIVVESVAPTEEEETAAASQDDILDVIETFKSVTEAREEPEGVTTTFTGGITEVEDTLIDAGVSEQEEAAPSESPSESVQEKSATAEVAKPLEIFVPDDADLDAEGRYEVVLALANRGDAESVRRIIGYLKDENADVRKGSAWVLSMVVADTSPAIPHLIESLGDESGEVRAEVAATLGQIGRGQTEVETALNELLQDSDPQVVEAAEEALRTLSGEGVDTEE